MEDKSNKVFFTDIDMFRNKKTPYKIVTPKKSNGTEDMAAKELKYFFHLATGVELDIVRDDLVAFDVSQYYFSIGNTSLYKDLQLDLLQTEYQDKVLLLSKGNMIFLNGSGKGCIFAVYELLKILFDYCYYAKDEIKLQKKKVLKVPVLDIRFCPAIPRRSLGYFDTESESEHIYRLKLGNTLYSGWIEHCHTYFKILPKEKYFKKHPDWYSPDGTNLCLSNAKMKEEFIRRIEELIEEKDGCYFMLGQEDTYDFCGCDQCKKKIAEYGCASGLVMEFTNDVAIRVGAWLNEKYPDRNVRFVAFAYNMTFKPPVRFNKFKGKFEPLKKSFIAAPNVSVMVVPYNAIYSVDYLDIKNEFVREGLWGWQVISNELMIWSYCTIYQNYMLPFNNLTALKNNYEILKEIGITFLYDGASHDTHVPCFEELKQYVHANLMWDTSLNTQNLVNDFLQVYYKEAAPYMRYILHLWQDRWYFIESTYQKYLYAFDSFNDLMDKRYWSKQFLNSLEEAFVGAFQSVKESKQSQLLNDRIEKEYMTVQFLNITLYPETLSDIAGEKKDFWKKREKYNIRYLKEGGDGDLWKN